MRQVIEDELRDAGTRLRDLDVRLELGLQESVKSAVEAGHGVTFISRTAVERELEAGTLAEARVRGPRAVARDLARARRGPRVDPRRRRVRRVRAGAAVIVRWGLGELPGRARGARRRASVPRREPALGCARRGGRRVARGAVRPDRGRRRLGRAAPTASSRSAAAARSTSRRRSRPRPGSRSSRCRRRTPAPSGRRPSGSAITTGACEAAAPARSSPGSSTTRSSRSACRGRRRSARAMNALDAHGRGALRQGPERGGRPGGARRRDA